MNRGLLAKTWLETRSSTLGFALGLALAEGILAFVIPIMLSSYGQQLIQLPFVQRFIAGLLGTASIEGLGTNVLRSVAWVHPMVLAIFWAHAITFGTRMPAGETDRGTIDILLGLPVTRFAALVSDGVVCAASALLVVAAALIGNLIGGSLSTTTPQTPFAVTLSIAANFYALYVAVAGLSYWVSVCSDRRGRAVAVTIAFVLASFLLNFVAQLWTPARPFGAASLLEYYRPLQLVQNGALPIRDISVLFAFGALCWTAAAVVFSKRDLRTS